MLKAPKVLANSIPKSGTNLLLRSLYLQPALRRKIQRTIQGHDIPGILASLESLNPSDVAAAHIKYHPEVSARIQMCEIKHILMIRDPRDIAVSNFEYIKQTRARHRLHGYFAHTLRTDAERLMASMTGIPSSELGGQPASLGLADHLKGYADWMDSPDVLVVRFEDLVGIQGGGDSDTQRKVVEQIVEYLEIAMDADRLRRLAEEIFSTHTRTFNKGRVGGWRDYFDSKHIEFFDKEIAPIAYKLGYGD